MIRQLWTLSVHTRTFLRRYMPTNILLDAIRTRRGLKWGVPAMLLAVPYLLAASTFTQIIADGGPGWLNLLVLLCLWNTMKFIIMGPVSVIMLARILTNEAGRRRHHTHTRRAARHAHRRPPPP
ncbi:MAG: sulfate permease [Microbacterium sp.]